MARQKANSLVVEFHGDWEDYSKWFDEQIAKIETNRDPDAVDLTGSLMRFGRADGHAFYLVVKHNPLTLQHVAIGDSYTVEDAMIRGLREADIRKEIERMKFWRDLAERNRMERAAQSK